jgi:hypothetical protein
MIHAIRSVPLGVSATRAGSWLLTPLWTPLCPPPHRLLRPVAHRITGGHTVFSGEPTAHGMARLRHMAIANLGELANRTGAGPVHSLGHTMCESDLIHDHGLGYSVRSGSSASRGKLIQAERSLLLPLQAAAGYLSWKPSSPRQSATWKIREFRRFGTNTPLQLLCSASLADGGGG